VAEVVVSEEQLVYIGGPQPGLDQLVGRGRATSDHDQLAGDCIIAAVFGVDFGGKRAYWVYNVKRGKFYPLVLSGERERDNSAEMRLGGLMEEESIPVERSLEQWYALWDIPF